MKLHNMRMNWYKANSKLRTEREKIATQEEIVHLINTETGKDHTRAWYTRIETGERAASMEVALVISRLLRVDVDEIFSSSKANTEQK